MRSTKKILWTLFLLPILLVNIKPALALDDNDDDAPEVTARVACISFLRGEAQIRRAGGTDWERAAQNLPIVEGDEIATGADARLEIQFNRDNYLRLSENAYLKVTTLRDEGIALSLPNGILSLRVLNFDKDRAFFEIDAPQSTIAVQKAGSYRIDAGDDDTNRVRVTVFDDGQAQIYSDNAGFTLRAGHSSELQLAGDDAGEWNTADARSFSDDFDNWALERDAVIAKRLRDAYYDQYYDRDIYGAEDLNGYGEWIYTQNYGYVWKPFTAAISAYDNWSPYRYGQWRWIPPYGWTWVNDEPWGWATYHHGRWVYDNGWYWSPYPQHRARRSWWRPALVVVTYISNTVCWYPLPYNYGYYNYNRATYIDRRRYNTTVINNTTVVVNPTPTPAPHPSLAATLRGPGQTSLKIPQSGVVSVPLSEFGRSRDNFRPAPLETAKKALAASASEIRTPPPLPTLRDLNGRVSREIRAEPPQNERVETRIKTGAAERKIGASMNEQLRTERIYGNRPPIERKSNTELKSGSEMNPPLRDTGAVKRVPRSTYQQEENNSETKYSAPREISPPVRSTGGKSEDTNEVRPVRKQRGGENEISPAPPTYEPPRREKREVRPSPPISEPAPKREEPRQPPPPRNDSPPKREPTPPQPPPPPKTESQPRKSEPQPIQPPRQGKGKPDKDG